MTTLAVTAGGMVTALGFNAPSTLAAIQGGISGVSESDWLDYESGEPLQVAKVPLPHWWEGPGKFADLLAPAIEECLQTANPSLRGETPLLLGVSSHARPNRLATHDRDFWIAIHSALDLKVSPHSAMFAEDQVGCARALARAQQIIESGVATQVIVGGVDSFLSQRTLDAYMEQRRVMTPSNSNGFFPGEAGCAVLVQAHDASDSNALVIHGQGFAEEEATIAETKPFRAVGMTQAVREALKSAGVTLKDVSYRLTDLSGEHYKFKEAAFAAGRLNNGGPESTLDLWHPIEFLGEIGAAILPCLLTLALDAARQGYAPGALALCHIGSDAGARAALVVGPQSARR